MSGIFNGLQAILNTLFAPIMYLGYIIKTIYEFGELIYATVATAVTNVMTLPQIILKYAILSLSIIVVLRLLGREAK